MCIRDRPLAGVEVEQFQDTVVIHRENKPPEVLTAGTASRYREEKGQMVKNTPKPLAVRPPSVDVAMMLEKVIEGGVTGEGVEALEKLIGLYERMEDRKSEQLFNEAFKSMQEVMPRV